MKDKIGCLLIHGFGGGVHEVKPLANYLRDTGLLVVYARLKGHTGHPKDMKRATYKDWIESAENELVCLKKKRKDIVIIGFSMGGLIGINLASKYNIKAIITINSPIYYWDLKRIFINIIEDFRCKKFNNINRYLHAKKACPFISMLNFLRILNVTKSKLASITCPFLITQTKDDDTTRLKSVAYIYNNISSQYKKVRLYEKGGHLVLLSPYKDVLIKDVTRFLKRLGWHFLYYPILL